VDRVKSFTEHYGFNTNDAKIAVEYYREYYSTNDIYENKLYNGIKNVLKALNEKIVNCIIAT
jgi:phosphoglycolate phosphatase